MVEMGLAVAPWCPYLASGGGLNGSLSSFIFAFPFFLHLHLLFPLRQCSALVSWCVCASLGFVASVDALLSPTIHPTHRVREAQAEAEKAAAAALMDERKEAAKAKAKREEEERKAQAQELIRRAMEFQRSQKLKMLEGILKKEKEEEESELRRQEREDMANFKKKAN